MITFILLFFFVVLSVVFAGVAYSATSRKRAYAAKYRPQPTQRASSQGVSNQN